MKHSFFYNKFKPDVPFAGTPSAPSITTGVLSITAEPEFGARRHTYHFWVTDTSCLDDSISHFQQNGYPDSTFTKYTSRSQWNKSYPDSILRADSLPIMPTPPPSPIEPTPTATASSTPHPFIPTKSPAPSQKPSSADAPNESDAVPREESALPVEKPPPLQDSPLRTPTLTLRSFLLSKRHRSTLPKSTSKN